MDNVEFVNLLLGIGCLFLIYGGIRTLFAMFDCVERGDYARVFGGVLILAVISFLLLKFETREKYNPETKIEQRTGNVKESNLNISQNSAKEAEHFEELCSYCNCNTKTKKEELDNE